MRPPDTNITLIVFPNSGLIYAVNKNLVLNMFESVIAGYNEHPIRFIDNECIFHRDVDICVIGNSHFH